MGFLLLCSQQTTADHTLLESPFSMAGGEANTNTTNGKVKNQKKHMQSQKTR